VDPRHAVGVTAFCASGAASPLRISPESEGDTEGGAPPGAPPRLAQSMIRKSGTRFSEKIMLK
jgi:hypothetical protein